MIAPTPAGSGPGHFLEVYFEGTIAPEISADGMVQVAEPVRIADGLERESFVIRLSSVSRTGFHPLMDQLAGKRVRILIQEIVPRPKAI